METVGIGFDISRACRRLRRRFGDDGRGLDDDDSDSDEYVDDRHGRFDDGL